MMCSKMVVMMATYGPGRQGRWRNGGLVFHVATVFSVCWVTTEFLRVFRLLRKSRLRQCQDTLLIGKGIGPA